MYLLGSNDVVSVLLGTCFGRAPVLRGRTEGPGWDVVARLAATVTVPASGETVQGVLAGVRRKASSLFKNLRIRSSRGNEALFC
jgi:hypothetical protein